MIEFIQNRLKFLILLSIFILNLAIAHSEIVKEIIITGNIRISKETILMFSEVSKNKNISDLEVNEILKKLYETNFFDNVSVSLKNKILKINVSENPIIYKIKFKGLKSNTLQDKISDNLKLKERSSYNEILLNEDKI